MIDFENDTIFFQTVRRLIALANRLENLRPHHELLGFTRSASPDEDSAVLIALYAYFGPPELDVTEMVRRGAYRYVYTQLLRALEFAVMYPDEPIMVRHDPAEYTSFFN
ncbi:MAG: hypothetical protein ACEQSB_01110 [Undibacterium sp.]